MDDGYFTCRDDESNLSEIMLDVQKIYERISDETSKKIYINRLLYSLTLDIQYIRNIILSTKAGMSFKHRLSNTTNPILIYGAGKRGKELVELFPDIGWKGYIDKNKRGSIWNLDIKTCEEYSDLKDSMIVISNVSEYDEIRNNLINKGVNSNNIVILEEWNIEAAQNQYFEPHCIKMEKIVNGFVDVGCYDGTNSIQFCKKTRNKHCKVWAFEPDKVQYQVCKTNLSYLKSVNLYNIAISDISYIKMDTEGYEKRVLRGCKNIIREQKPALAICVYHKRSDILEIPNKLLDYNPNYRFAFGHYGITQAESVLYAF